MQLKKIGRGGGLGLDYVIFLPQGGWVLITVDYGGEGGGDKNAKKNDNVIYERPLYYLCLRVRRE